MRALENKVFSIEPRAKRGEMHRAMMAWIALSFAFSLSSARLASANAAPQERTDASVRVTVRNIKYRFAENVSVQVKKLTGALIPVGDSKMPAFDDKESFKVRIDSAEVAIGYQDLANLLNQFVFARPGSPLSDVSVTTSEQGRLKVKGRLKEKGNIPFETQGALVPTSDGKLRLHAGKVKALKIPVQGLMDALGIEIDNFIKSGKVPGVNTEQNDLIFDLEQMLPAPHVEGRVTNVRVEPNAIVQTFATDAKRADDNKSEPKFPGNYIALRGNNVQFGKLTMEDCDIVLMDMSPSDPLDFFLDHYKEQVAAGYTKISASFLIRAYIKDYEKLTQGNKDATQASKK